MNTRALIFVSAALLFFSMSCKTQTQIERSKPMNEAASIASQPDNRRNALDWKGVYTGTLPCADCQGIQTALRLVDDSSYTIQIKYLDKSDQVYESRGTFSWNSQGNKITLKHVEPFKSPLMYQVGENRLFQLDLNGNRISGELADNYILAKVPDGLTEKYWKLTEIRGKQVTFDEAFKKEPHLILKTEGNRLIGNGGCNSFTGSYELKPGNRIAFSKIAATQMACLNMEIESQLLKILETADNYSLNGDTLALNKARMAPLARFEAVYLK